MKIAVTTEYPRVCPFCASVLAEISPITPDLFHLGSAVVCSCDALITRAEHWRLVDAAGKSGSDLVSIIADLGPDVLASKP